MTMVAEGVEDEETLVVLEDLGVDLAQGYLFGRPEIVGEVSGAGGGQVEAPPGRTLI